MQFPATHVISELPQLISLGKELLSATPIKIILLEGDLGVGKTTFVQALCKILEVTDPVQSPTFSIINEYQTKNKQRVAHMDLYRIRNIQEAIDLGIDEYLHSEDYCFIEWPEIIKEYVPQKSISVYIEHADRNTRQIKLNLV